MTIRRVCVALLSLAGVAACGPDEATSAGPGPAVVDSAGIRITTNALPAPLDTLQAELQWEYGTNAAEYLFQRVRTGVLRGDGSGVIADAGNGEVVAIAPGGLRHRLIAPEGQGPAEVELPIQVVTDGSSDVWVEDFHGRKLLQFIDDSLAAVIAGTANLPAREMLTAVGVHPDGRLLLTTGGFDPEFEGPWRYASLAIFDPVGSAIDTVGSFRLAPRVDPPISPFGGWGVVTVSGAEFVTGFTDRPELVRRSAEGDVSHFVRWSEATRYFDDIVGAADGSVWLVPASPSRTSSRGASEFDVLGSIATLAACLGFGACDDPVVTGGIFAVDAVVTGSVMSASGTPIEDATIQFRLWSPGTPCEDPPQLTVATSFRSDVEGRYVAPVSLMNVPDSTYCVRVVATSGEDADSVDLPAVPFRRFGGPDTTVAPPLVLSPSR